MNRHSKSQRQLTKREQNSSGKGKTVLELIQLKRTSTPCPTARAFEDLRQKLDERMDRRASTARQAENHPPNQSQDSNVKSRMLALLKDREAVLARAQERAAPLLEFRD
jgi:hypothetical protein